MTSGRPRDRRGRVSEQVLAEVADLDLGELQGLVTTSERMGDWESLPLKTRRRDVAWARDVIEHLDVIASRAAQGKDDFDASDSLLRDAIQLRIINFGHAVKSLSASCRALFPTQPLSGVVGMRDRVAHDYVQVDTEIVWATIVSDLPRIREEFQSFLDQHGHLAG